MILSGLARRTARNSRKYHHFTFSASGRKERLPALQMQTSSVQSDERPSVQLRGMHVQAEGLASIAAEGNRAASGFGRPYSSRNIFAVLVVLVGDHVVQARAVPDEVHLAPRLREQLRRFGGQRLALRVVLIVHVAGVPLARPDVSDGRVPHGDGRAVVGEGVLNLVPRRPAPW